MSNPFIIMCSISGKTEQDAMNKQLEYASYRGAQVQFTTPVPKGSKWVIWFRDDYRIYRKTIEWIKRKKESKR